MALHKVGRALLKGDSKGYYRNTLLQLNSPAFLSTNVTTPCRDTWIACSNCTRPISRPNQPIPDQRIQGSVSRALGLGLGTQGLHTSAKVRNSGGSGSRNPEGFGTGHSQMKLLASGHNSCIFNSHLQAFFSTIFSRNWKRYTLLY